MPPLTLFLDMVAVAAGLLVNGVALGAIALAALYVLGQSRDARRKNE